MGINFDGLNPESKAKLEQIVADGKVTAEEVKGLTEAEKEALADELGGRDLPVEGEIKIGDAPEQEKEEPGFFEKNLGWIIGGATAVGVGIAALATKGKGVPKILDFLKGHKATVAAGAALVGASTLTSCKYDVDQDAEFNNSGYQELLAIVQDKEKADAKRHQEMLLVLMTIGQSINEIVKTLTSMGAKLDEIIDVMLTYGSTGEEIVKLLKDQGKDIKAIYAALGEMNIEQSKQTELLKELVGNDNVKIEYLEQILNEVRNGNKLQANEQDILNKILEKLDKLNENDQQGAELMNQILAQLTAFVKQEGDMDATTHALLQTIINNQESMSYNIKVDITEILKKLDQMDENAKARFTAIIPLLGSIGDLGVEILNAVKNGNALTAAQLDDIRELIMKNNEIAQQTQDAVKDMSSKMSEEHKAILEAIKNGTASVDDIQKILVEIKNNTSVLPDMNKKLCVIGTAIEQVLKEVQGMREETKLGLLAILAKIPDGCHCQPTDISGIIDLLNKLLDAIQKNPDDDKNHEGILTDLNKYFD